MFKDKRSSFTLIEMIMVATIFSIIGSAVTFSFISGIKLWNRVQKLEFSDYYTLLNMEIIAKDLRQSVPSDYIPFTGEVRKMSFPTFDGDSLVKIIYQFDPYQKVILRKKLSLKEIVTEEDEAVYKKEEKLMGAENFSLKYLYFDKETEQWSWVDSWDKEKGIFKAVKLKINDIKNKEFTKTIFIPVR